MERHSSGARRFGAIDSLRGLGIEQEKSFDRDHDIDPTSLRSGLRVPHLTRTTSRP